eukprot:NODE_4_length_77007_cov_1.156642.p9 type:complete len:572 gc:universal NODE_4_length_77007_cov_1.156642:8523-10238(+)
MKIAPNLTESFLLSKESATLMISRFRYCEQIPQVEDWHNAFYNLKYQEILECHLTDSELEVLIQYCTSTNLVTFKYIVLHLLMRNKFDKGVLYYYAFKALHTDRKLDQYFVDKTKNMPVFVKDKLKRSAMDLRFPNLELDPSRQILKRPILDNDYFGLTVGVPDDGNRVFQFRKDVVEVGNISQISFTSFRYQENQNVHLTPKRKSSRSLSKFVSPIKKKESDIMKTPDLYSILTTDEPVTPKSPKQQRRGLAMSPRASSRISVSSNFIPFDKIPTSPAKEYIKEFIDEKQRSRSTFASDAQAVSFKSVEMRKSTPRHPVARDEVDLQQAELKLEPDSPLKMKSKSTENQGNSVNLSISSSGLDSDRLEGLKRDSRTLDNPLATFKKFKLEQPTSDIQLGLSSDAAEKAHSKTKPTITPFASSDDEILEELTSKMVPVIPIVPPKEDSFSTQKNKIESEAGSAATQKKKSESDIGSGLVTPRRSKRIQSKSEFSSVATSAATSRPGSPLLNISRKKSKAKKGTSTNVAGKRGLSKDLKNRVEAAINETPKRNIQKASSSRSRKKSQSDQPK